MRTKFLKRESDYSGVMWEVAEGRRWWTVFFRTSDGTYHITSDSGREVKPDGPLGRRLIEAIK